MAKETNQVVRVAIQRPIYKLLDYTCNAVNVPTPGVRVKVPLGNISVIGIVVESEIESDIDKLKSIHHIIDEKPIINPKMMALLKWASQYYFYPIGEVIFHSLPSNLRKGKAISKKILWRIIENEKDINLLSRAPKQLAMFEYLSKGKKDSDSLQKKFGKNWRNILKELLGKKLVEAIEVEEKSSNLNQNKNIEIQQTNIQLTTEQLKAVEEISEAFSSLPLKPILLHGVTGSGKTEVYFNLIEPLLAENKQILVLVPEIGLTPQLFDRFKQRFPYTEITIMHSAMSNLEREKVWLAAGKSEIQIIIGTRSAVFIPMENIGAIIVDEEHDASFKQQEGFLYHGRDLAIKRAHDENIPIILGSATPSLETLHNANLNRYHHISLDSRPGYRQLPEIEVLDVSAIPLEAGISQQLMGEIKQHLNMNCQVMLFLNRRGFAPVLMCPNCGWHSSCSKCDVGMTFHASVSKIICHHCGAEEEVRSSCPSCNKESLTTLGQGTERIEDILNTHFPDFPVIRVDRDSTAKKGDLEKKFERVKNGEAVILIGTQMLTKGHDFPNLTLVGILDIDQALFSIDFRAQERIAQQILQVAGRAGRSEKKGRVVLQTTQPKHPVLLDLLSKGYKDTANQILNERRAWNYPPIGAQALIRVSATEITKAKQFIQKVYIELLDKKNTKVDLMGPMPSALAKRASRFRFQLLLSSNDGRMELHRLISSALPNLLKIKKTGGVRWTIDIDPIDFL